LILFLEDEIDDNSNRKNQLEEFQELFKLCYCVWNNLVEEQWFSIDDDSNALKSIFLFF